MCCLVKKNDYFISVKIKMLKNKNKKEERILVC